MTATTTSPRVLIHDAEFLPLLPLTLSPEQVRRWRRSGCYPKGHRIGSRVAKKLYDVEDVIAWCDATFGKLFPSECEQFACKLRTKKSCSINSSYKNR